MMRPVFNLELEQLELIGTFEQVYLDISISEDEIRPGVSIILVYIQNYIERICYFVYCSFNLDNHTQRGYEN